MTPPRRGGRRAAQAHENAVRALKRVVIEEDQALADSLQKEAQNGYLAQGAGMTRKHRVAADGRRPG
jgi:hypothetical protein